MAPPRGVGDLGFLQKINVFTKKPESFLGVQEHAAQEIVSLLKSVYDFTQVAEGRHSASEALPELIIQDFDEEQIWQELELQNDFTINSVLSGVAVLVAHKEQLVLSLETDADKPNKDLKSKDSLGNYNHEAKNDDDTSEYDDYDAENGEDQAENVLSYGREPATAIGDGKARLGRTVKPKKERSVVDDQFFKLHDLDAFLEAEDRKAEKANAENQSDEEEEDVDLFDGKYEDDLGDELFRSSVGTEAKLARFKAFFDPPDSDEAFEDDVDNQPEDHNVHQNEMEDVSHKSRKVRFNLLPDVENKESCGAEPITDEMKSTFETRQERLKKKIGHLETAALAEKPWQLKGEIAGKSRPINSLLEEVVEFAMTSRPAPIITEQTTLKLEDLILQRIKNKLWDDVLRQTKIVQAPQELKKMLVLNQEKSKQSLAEVYEREYLKERNKTLLVEEEDEKESDNFANIRKLMTSLFSSLDALSNFHYTPKQIAPELKVITNTPAITMEEVAPVATTNASLLAPEEVKAKPKGDLMSKQDRSSSDKNRERRYKKKMQKDKYLLKGLSAKNQELPKKKRLPKKRLDKTVKKAPKSSTAFFKELQEEVTTHIKSKSKPKKSRVERVSAKSVKL